MTSLEIDIPCFEDRAQISLSPAEEVYVEEVCIDLWMHIKHLLLPPSVDPALTWFFLTHDCDWDDGVSTSPSHRVYDALAAWEAGQLVLLESPLILSPRGNLLQGHHRSVYRPPRAGMDGGPSTDDKPMSNGEKI